jgi:hypothetical protein
MHGKRGGGSPSVQDFGERRPERVLVRGPTGQGEESRGVAERV